MPETPPLTKEEIASVIVSAVLVEFVACDNVRLEKFKDLLLERLKEFTSESALRHHDFQHYAMSMAAMSELKLQFL